MAICALCLEQPREKLKAGDEGIGNLNIPERRELCTTIMKETFVIIITRSIVYSYYVSLDTCDER